MRRVYCKVLSYRMDIKHFADIMHEIFFETSTSEFQINVQYILDFKLSGYF